MSNTTNTVDGAREEMFTVMSMHTCYGQAEKEGSYSAAAEQRRKAQRMTG